MPFLQRLNPEVRIVPICLADPGLEALLNLGKGLAEVMDDDVLMVISSDMTHFESRQAAANKDRLALDRIRELDATGLYRVVRDRPISMCGVVPATAGLAACVARGGKQAELIDYSCSGDVTGDDRNVVAYAGLKVT